MAKVIGLVESVCPNCLKKIMGQKVEYEDEVYLEKNCEESAYLIQFGKARIAQKSIKQAVNYLKGASMSSFLLIGEFEQVGKLMKLLPKLEKNYKEIANIINLVCDEKGINKVIYLIQGIDGASLILFSFGGES